MKIKKNSGEAAGFTRVEALVSGTVFDADGLPNNVVKGTYYLIEGEFDKGVFKELTPAKPTAPRAKEESK